MFGLNPSTPNFVSNTADTIMLHVGHIINGWNEIVTDIDPPCFFEALKEYCTTTNPSSWRLLFTNQSELKKVVKRFIDIGGSVLVLGKSTNVENIVHTRLCKSMRSASAEYGVIVSFMAKVYERLDSNNLPMDRILGKEALTRYADLKTAQPVWQLEMSPAILNTTILELSGQCDCRKYLEKAVFYLELAKSHSIDSGNQISNLLAMLNEHLNICRLN